MSKSITGKFFLIFLSLTAIFGCSKDEEIKEDLSIGLLKEVNKLRKEGCQCGADFIPPVKEMKWNKALEFSSDEHVKDMYNNNYFDHISLDGKSPIQRAMAAGYTGDPVEEDIARGYSTIKEVVNAWKNSESHCRAMMDSICLEMGAARYKDYWVMDMGKPL